MRCLLVLLCVVLGLAATAEERLVVFVDGGANSAVQAGFANEQLPALRELGEELGVEVVVFDVNENLGVPEGVNITPLIAFQNWRGTSIYQGRYTTLERVRNFVRTSRFMPQGEATLVREGVPVKRVGRTTLAVPLKVTDFAGPGVDRLEGTEFAGLDETPFEDRDVSWLIRLGIASGMESSGFLFNWGEVELERSDRSWYADFHPYVSEDGTLFVGTELYSQFHCHEPVASWLNDPVSGPLEQVVRVFAEAAERVAKEIDRQLVESELGDGFDVVDQRAVPWDWVGLALPARPEGVAAEFADVSLPGAWVVDVEAQEDGPAVQFTWPAPVDAYSGEASEITGTVRLGGDAEGGWTFAGMTGEFIAATDSVTMGESDLDAYIHSGLLEVGEYPEARFVFERVEVDAAQAGRAVTLGELVPATLVGAFTMKDVTIPLSVPMSVESFVGEDGRPRLAMTGRWGISLMEPWGIEGPPGPKDASDSMLFGCRIVLEPE